MTCEPLISTLSSFESFIALLPAIIVIASFSFEGAASSILEKKLITTVSSPCVKASSGIICWSPLVFPVSLCLKKTSFTVSSNLTTILNSFDSLASLIGILTDWRLSVPWRAGFSVEYSTYSPFTFS